MTIKEQILLELAERVLQEGTFSSSFLKEFIRMVQGDSLTKENMAALIRKELASDTTNQETAD